VKALLILALSDIHGNVKATRSLVEHLKAKSYIIDLIIIAGDLPATTSLAVMARYMIRHPLVAFSKKKYTHWAYKGKGRKFFVAKQISSINKVLDLLSSLNTPIIYIPGNVDSYDALEFIENWIPKIHVLNSCPFQELDICVIGTGGALLPPHYSEPLCDHEYIETDYEEKWDNMMHKNSEIIKNVDILVTHEPPQFEVQLKDKRVINGGSIKVSEVVRQSNTRLVIFGHYHEFSLSKKVGEVTYVNPGPLACYYYTFINYTPEKISVSLNMLPSAKLDSINKIYSKRTTKNISYRSVRFV
jgi:Icc-related predicted phosphoesterase